jgi:hypothetical protein
MSSIHRPRQLRPYLASLLFLVLQVLAADPPMEKQTSGTLIGMPYDPYACAPNGVGVGGYDLVSYRLPDGPVPGRSDLFVEHQELKYLFSSEEHKQEFLADRDYYLPAYDGWCAITLALGRVTCPDFTNFKVEVDRLLLFEVTGFTNGRTVWNSDPLTYRKKADANFEVLKKPQ